MNRMSKYDHIYQAHVSHKKAEEIKKIFIEKNRAGKSHTAEYWEDYHKYLDLYLVYKDSEELHLLRSGLNKKEQTELVQSWDI